MSFLCNEISRPVILEHLPILLLNFNSYCIVCTVRTTHYKGLLFVKGICQTIYHCNCFWMFMKPHTLGLTTWRDVIENCIDFQNIFRSNKPLKFVVLALFGDFSAEIWIKQKLHNSSLPCYETRSFAKKQCLKKIAKLIFTSNFTIKELFPQLIKYLTAFSDYLAFFQHGLSVFIKLNLMLTNL